jgi:nitrogen fixation/metabolism regulation signal transduction histidine kinase
MEQTAQKLASGEVTQDLSIHTGDEVEKLADSFNYMKKQYNECKSKDKA